MLKRTRREPKYLGPVTNPARCANCGTKGPTRPVAVPARFRRRKTVLFCRPCAERW